MALEVVTDSKNDKTENMYTTREHRKEHVFCVPLSFVLKDNKYVRSCVIIRCKQPVERKQRRTENETVVFISS